jgi:hypothetical protein
VSEPNPNLIAHLKALADGMCTRDNDALVREAIRTINRLKRSQRKLADALLWHGPSGNYGVRRPLKVVSAMEHARMVMEHAPTIH